jgi:hypothetical protein
MAAYDRNTIFQIKRSFTIQGILGGSIDTLGHADFVPGQGCKQSVLEVIERICPGRTIVGPGGIIVNIDYLGCHSRA